MATTSVLRLKVEDKEYNASLRQAQQGMQHLQQALQAAGKTFSQVDKSVVEYARGIGQMEAKSKTARGRIGEMTSAFVELSSQYNKLSAEVKSSDVGKAMSQSLEQLRQRTIAAKQELAGLNSQLEPLKGNASQTSSGMGRLSDMLSTYGSKLGISSELTGMLTSGTVALTGAVGAAIAVIGKGADAWASYNSELALQDQVTQVTTGLRGPSADTMTDTFRALSDTYKVDFREAVNAANTLMTQFGATGSEAIQLIKDGMQGMIQGDGPKLLSMIQQYAPSFRDAGISASQLVAIIHNSEGGIFTDQNMNAIVMGIKNIRLMTKATADALAQMGIDGEAMARKLNDGTMTIFEALSQVATAIDGTTSGSQAAGQVMQQVFGRQGAAAGTKLGEAIATLNINLEETKNQTGELGQRLSELQTANERLNKAIRECFGYRGYEEMADGIKAKLITALSNVLELTAKCGSGFEGMFNKFLVGIQAALGPLSRYVNLLQYVRGNTNPGNGGQSSGSGGSGNQGGGGGGGVRGGTTDSRSNTPAVTIPGNTGTRNPITPRVNATHKVTDHERAAQKVAEAERTYAETLLKNSIRMEAGLDSTLENKKKELSAQERLFDAYNDAYVTYKNPAYKEASQQAAEKIKQLASEVKAASDAQEASKKAARELEAAQKKLADAQQKLADARTTGSATAIYKAQQNVDRQQASVDMLSGRIPTDYKATMTVTADTKEAIDKLKEIDGVSIDEKSMTVTADTQDALDKLREINGMSIDEKTVKIVPKTEGNTPFENLVQSVKADIRFDRMEVDETTLTSLLTVAIQHGLDSVTVDYGGLQQRIAEGIDIPDETWQQLKTEINEKLKEMGLEPIELDVKTGSVQSGKGGGNDNPYLKMNKDGKLEAKATELMSGIAGGIQNVVGGLQQLGIDLPQGFQNVVSGIQTVTSILSGIMSIVIAIKAITTADIIVPGFMANGGIVPKFAGGGLIGHAAAGMLIPGNSFSGDRLRMPVDGGSGFIGVNSGELILNAAQQNTIAGMLQGGQGMVHVTGELQGEKIVLAANRFLKRSGRGELVTWK